MQPSIATSSSTSTITNAPALHRSIAIDACRCVAKVAYKTLAVGPTHLDISHAETTLLNPSLPKSLIIDVSSYHRMRVFQRVIYSGRGSGFQGRSQGGQRAHSR